MNTRGKTTGENMESQANGIATVAVAEDNHQNQTVTLLTGRPTAQPAASAWLGSINSTTLVRVVWLMLIVIALLSPSPLASNDYEKIKTLANVLAYALHNTSKQA